MKTLYELIGGEDNIRKLVTAFYQRVLNDPLLQPFFEGVSVDKLQRMQVSFFSIALGGPEPPFVISLSDAHRGRGIRSDHLTRFTQHLLGTLEEIGIEEKAAQRVYERIGTYSNEILGESNVDG